MTEADLTRLTQEQRDMLAAAPPAIRAQMLAEIARAQQMQERTVQAGGAGPSE